MNASVRYTVWRLLIFVVVLVVCFVIPPLRDNPILLLLVAGTVSMLVSLFGLSRMRNEMASEVATRIEQRHLRHDAKWADEVNEDYEDEHPEPHPHKAASDLDDRA